MRQPPTARRGPDRTVQCKVAEELGLHAGPPHLIGVYAFEQMHHVIVAYHRHPEGEIELSDELSDFRRIPKLRPWPIGTGLAVEDWLRAQKERAPEGS